MSQESKILVSGIQPSGKLHIGNYFGAVKQFVDFQNDYDSHIFIADLHSINTIQNREELSRNILDLATDYLALGIDPKKVTLYKQSDVPEVTELAWIFNCITTVPYLMRAHAFKDAEIKRKEVSVGLFDYPMLMSADILIQDADVVPVGLDQKQHLEIAKDTGEKFNRVFGETFVLPAPLILETVQTIPGIDGQKMSKSYKNTIGLFATDAEIREAVMKIATDSKGVDEPKDPEKDTVFALHKLFTEGPEFEDLRDKYENGGIGYKDSKEILIRNITKFITPLRAKREELENKPDYVREILKAGGEKARKRAQEKMVDVRAKVGVTI
jgi:tryptophanyl-tRNA synthetase